MNVNAGYLSLALHALTTSAWCEDTWSSLLVTPLAAWSATALEVPTSACNTCP